MNLLFNARDAMPKGGVISLVAALIYEGAVATEVELRVTDNGFGMTKDTLLRAMDPFFTTKTTGLGGLGLPMVDELRPGGRRTPLHRKRTRRRHDRDLAVAHFRVGGSAPAGFAELPKANSVSSCHYLFGIWPRHPSISTSPR